MDGLRPVVRESNLLIDVAKDFSANALPTRVSVGHDAAGRGDNGNADAAEYAGQLFAVGVDAQSGLANAGQAADDGLALLAFVLERDGDFAVDTFTTLFRIGYEAFFF